MLLNEVDEADLLIESNESAENAEKKSNNAVKLLSVDEFEEWQKPVILQTACFDDAVVDEEDAEDSCEKYAE